MGTKEVGRGEVIDEGNSALFAGCMEHLVEVFLGFNASRPNSPTPMMKRGSLSSRRSFLY